MSANHDCRIIVIDEGYEKMRKKNNLLLSEIPHTYYGGHEREEWFKQRFGSNFQRYLSVIPKRCHAETSFGFLVAYEEQPDLVIEVDDDVFFNKEFLLHHLDNLFNHNGVTVYSEGKWYNTLDNLECDVDTNVFPRGHPYAPDTRTNNHTWREEGGESILNMGLWLGCPDLDALTILYKNCLDGRFYVEGKNCKIEKVILGKGTYSAICSMNTSFLPEIIPAFYQLYMNFLGIDRFDDIWSGIFLKKVTDHLGRRISLGEPLVNHNKRPRDVFRDLKKELGGMILNEVIWRIVDELELDGKTYWDSYSSLVSGLRENTMKIRDATLQKFMATQTEKMRLWLEIVDKLKR